PPPLPPEILFGGPGSEPGCQLLGSGAHTSLHADRVLPCSQRPLPPPSLEAFAVLSTLGRNRLLERGIVAGALDRPPHGGEQGVCGDHEKGPEGR
ncbi:unnamed protein product, partial [Gulo gulo]